MLIACGLRLLAASQTSHTKARFYKLLGSADFNTPGCCYGNEAQAGLTHGTPLDNPAKSRGFSFYLRGLAVRTVEVGPAVRTVEVGLAVRTVEVGNAFREDMGLLGRAAAGPVFLQVGTSFVEPTEVGYEPTEGATTDP